MITIVIPIHKIEENDFEFIDKCTESLNSQKSKDFKVAFVVSTDVTDDQKQKLTDSIDESIDVNIYINEGQTDYQSQVNFFVAHHLDTDWFSVLQFDDMLLKHQVHELNRHIKAYPEYDMFIPMIFELDDTNTFIGFSNESIWSKGHTQKLGYFNLEDAKRNHYANYNLCGAAIKAESFIEAGMLKASIKMYHGYEFLLRMLDKGNTIYVVPKLTYKHVNDRKGSIFNRIKDNTNHEKTFWYNLAKKEYVYDYDRELAYRPDVGNGQQIVNL